MSALNMPPTSSSLRHLSSSRVSSFKEFLHKPSLSTSSLTRASNAAGATDERRQSWRSWATQKIRSRIGSPQENSGNEVLTLFPGWAARRYGIDGNLVGESGEPVPFEVDAFVSGYAISHRSRSQGSRSQRAFMRLAKGFASLPRLTDQSSSTNDPSADSTDDLIDQVNTLQVSDEVQMQVLEGQFQSLNSADSDSEFESDSPKIVFPGSIGPSPPSTPAPKYINTPNDTLQKLHYNLESRLQLFWSSTLPARTVRIQLFSSPRNSPTNSFTDKSDEPECKPLASQDVVTGVDGSFSARFNIKWQDLCQHPRGLHIAYCETLEEHDLVFVAELLPLPPLPSNSSNSSNSELSSTSISQPTLSNPPTSSSHSNFRHSYHPDTQSGSHRYPHLRNVFPHLPTLHDLSSLASTSSLAHFFGPHGPTITRTIIPLTYSPIRVISDIDDTIKRSGVAEGARAAFHNVFVKELKDGIIPGMGDWYTDMWNKGLRFHYVSNGPFEYLSLLQEFFKLSKLPPGSIKLKSYAGRSLLSGLLSTPAARKRAGVIDILDAFLDSKFILIGDSGEQDLELYAELARERPTQILAVFIRDPDETSDVRLDDPTGWDALSIGNTLTGLTRPGHGDNQTTPRPGKARRMFSDTFTYSRSGNLINAPPLREEDHLNTETPTPQHLATFPDSSLLPTSPVSFTSPPSSSPPASFPLPTPSNPTTTSTFITMQPQPVPALITPTSSSSTTSSLSPPRNHPKRSTTDPYSVPQSHNLHPQGHGTTNPRPNFTQQPLSPIDISPPYYKPPESSSRSCHFGGLGSSGKRNSGVFNPTVMVPKTMPQPRQSGSSEGSESSSSWSGGGGASGGYGGGKGAEHKKRQDLQTRVYRARTQMPSNVKLRVFKEPGECFADVDGLLLSGVS